MAPLAHPVTISLEDLKNDTLSSVTLQEAFGPDSLGILVVKDVAPEFVSLRHHLLSYASYLGNLPESKLDKLENEKAKYLIGWSRGKESLKNGKVDTLKGSFYANCAFYVDPALSCAKPTEEYNADNFPEYLSPNFWPDEATLPGFRSVFEKLCTVIIDVAILVARACDRFAEEMDGTRDIYPTGYLEKVVRTSTTTKARLLHYFPCEEREATAKPTPAGQNANEDEADWCATHLDHGCLTGLTSAMFVDESSCKDAFTPRFEQNPGGETGIGNKDSKLTLAPIPELDASPDPAAGLYIISRSGGTVQVNIPRDCIAFQTGEALQRITAGRFKAVPHFVRGAKANLSVGKIARNTLAVFTQPNLGEVVDMQHALVFGEFAKRVVAKNTVS